MKTNNYLTIFAAISLQIGIISQSFGFNAVHECFNGNKAEALLCDSPNNITFSNSSYGLLLDWLSVTNAEKHDIEIGEVGFLPNTGEALIVHETPLSFFHITSDQLNPTYYDAYIRTQCSDGELSTFTGPHTFFMPPECGDQFYDSGGPNGDISAQEDLSITICPESPGESAQLTINELDIDPCCATMWAEVGQNNFMVIPLDGTHPPYIPSLKPDGCLTFITNNANTNASSGSGWDITVECVTCPTIPTPVIDKTFTDRVMFEWPSFFNSFLTVEWELGAVGFSPFSGEAIQANNFFSISASLTINNLQPDTPYEVYYRQKCDNETSLPNGPFYFKTAPTCGDKFYDTGGPDGLAGLNNIQPSSYILCPEQPNNAIIVDFSSIDIDATRLEVFDNDLDSGLPIATLQGQPLPDRFISTDITGCLSFQFRPILLAVEGWEADVSCTSCRPVTGYSTLGTGLEDANIGWYAIPNADNYYWEVGPIGFEPGTSNTLFSGTTSSNENSVQITGLDRNTLYEIYVRANCPSEDGLFYQSHQFSTQATCGDIYYDPGGPNSQYGHNIEVVTTICPSDPSDPVTVDFTLFNTEECCDVLKVHDGTSTAHTFLDWLAGTEFPPPYTSTHPSGCLTFHFVSNEGIAGNGWEAFVTCGATPVIETTILSSSVELFPNPSTDQINCLIHDNSVTEYDVEIRDVNGILFYEKTMTEKELSIPMETWPRGTYFAVFKNEKNTLTKRFVKL